MPKLIDITPEQRFVGMFIGESGTGKTCAECSFPKPIHVMDFDGRIRGAYGQPWLPMEGITYDFFPPREQGMVQRVNTYLESLQVAASVGQPVPKTLVMDSLTSECFAMLMQAMPLTHNKNAAAGERAGKYLGVTPMSGPEDYGFEAQVTYGILSFFRSVPIPNIIVSAHIIPTYGKADPNNPYSENIVTGEKLSVRDKIGANVGIYFDHVFRFRKTIGAYNKEKFTVEFRSQIARTAFTQLPEGEVDVTGKNFYSEIMMSYVKGQGDATNNSMG
jgi:hypothetical protein